MVLGIFSGGKGEGAECHGNLGALTSWNLLGHTEPVTGLLLLLPKAVIKAPLTTGNCGARKPFANKSSKILSGIRDISAPVSKTAINLSSPMSS